MGKKVVSESEDTGFSKKWDKFLKTMPETKDSLDSMGPDELKKVLMECEGHIYETEKEMQNDEKLRAAKELAADFSKGYKEAMKVEMCKIKYSLFLLKEKGSM